MADGGRRGSGDRRRLTRALDGETLSTPPVWLMRQAGRFLPEYRALRAQAPDFLAFCYDPEMASEATLQPIRRFGFDAAIIFSDILVIPDALGQRVRFVEGEGPRLDPVDLGRLDVLDASRQAEHLAPVYEALRRTRAALPDETALLGFAGAPWTLATYMVGAEGADKAVARRLAFADPAGFDALIARLVDAIAAHLVAQLDAGVDAVQIFDSWAGVLDPVAFERLVTAPTRTIVETVRAARPGARIIGFPRGAGGNLAAYAAATGVAAVGLDWTVPLDRAAELQQRLPVQGNLDPMRLVAGGAALDSGVDDILAALGRGPLVFNLGHGVTPETPIAHVERLLQRLRRA